MKIRYIILITVIATVLVSIDAFAQTRRCPFCSEPNLGRALGDGNTLPTTSVTGNNGGSIVNHSSLDIEDIRAANGRATCCFVAGTLIATETGLRAIEDIQIGDRVWARDTDTGVTALKRVVDLIRRHERKIWKVSVLGDNGNKEVFQTTDDHPWWVIDGDNGDWLKTEELAESNTLISRIPGDTDKTISIVKVVETDRIDTTYNLTVADFATYFVGENRVLVHNCPGPGRSPEAQARADANIAKGIPESQLGGSGHPRHHTIEHSSRKDAQQATALEVPSGGTVRNDATPSNPQQGPHFQAEDAHGNNVKPVVHHEYPKK